MNTISFILANYVARQLGYRMKQWGEGDRATQEYYKPLSTYRERLNAVLAEVRALGFNAIDLWLPFLNPDWATPEHVAIAQALLKQYGLAVVSLAGGFGSTREQFERVCALAPAFGAPALGGSTNLVDGDRAFVVKALRKHGVKLGYENHPAEKTPQDLLRKIGTGDEDVIGATIDTGWFGTQGYDAARAIEEVGPRIFHVHLKDVRESGTHHTCRFGEGVVPIQACVAALRRMAYSGAISIEHEPESFDPTEDIKASHAMLKRWLA